MKNSISKFFCSSSNTKKMFVKIIHPGGHVELHDRPILAAELLGRNPKCCVAHPTVFQKPHAAVVSPQTTLALGRKYYVVPFGTIRKLQLKHPRPSGDAIISDGGTDGYGDGGVEAPSFSSCWLFKSGGDNSKCLGSMSFGGGGRSRSQEETMKTETQKKRYDDYRESLDDAAAAAASPAGRLTLVSSDDWQPGRFWKV